MKLHICIVIINLILALGSPLQSQDKPKLNVGDKAPLLRIEDWIETPISLPFEKGTTYVIEFGGILCTPCRESIPHLSELQEKYRDFLKVISVYVWENGTHPSDTISKQYIQKVQEFVTIMDKNISYSVAVDTPSQRNFREWLEATNNVGIPVSFIINNHGTIVWIGHPLHITDSLVTKIVKGEFTTIDAKEDATTMSKMNSDYYSAKTSKDYDLALVLIEKLIDLYPHDSFLKIEKFGMLLEADQQAALTYGKKLLENEFKNSEPSLFYLMRKINENATKLPDIFLDLAIDVGTRAIYVSQYKVMDALILDAQGHSFYLKGDIQKAIEFKVAALDALKQYASDDAIRLRKYINDNLENLRRQSK